MLNKFHDLTHPVAAFVHVTDHRRLRLSLNARLAASILIARLATNPRDEVALLGGSQRHVASVRRCRPDRAVQPLAAPDNSSNALSRH